MKKDYDLYWKKLDNVGMFYASTTTTYDPNIYRLSVKLKEKVNKEVLETALSNTLQTIPSFKVKLRKGFFWYYLERNNDNPIIVEEHHFPYMSINNFNNNYFLFKVTYFEKRINVEFSHILTDGTGALYFLETLITNYMKIKHPRKVKEDIIVESELLSQNEMNVDSFIQYSKVKEVERKILKERDKKPYLIQGARKEKVNASVTIGTISVEQLKSITKAKGVTITTYLTAVLIYSIYHGNYKYYKGKEPILICIPVNLRKYFPSYSMNNFFSTIMVGVDAFKKDYSFDDLLEAVSNKLKEELDKSVLLEKFRFFANLQQNIILRFIPLVVKNALLRGIGGIISERGATTTLSNLGVISIAREVSEYIDKFDVISYTDNSLPIKVGICSFDDKLSIAFSSVLIDTDIERTFFTYLSNLGIDVRISSSIANSIKEVK
jgi:NRPS condensation-like uncharacterized protein